MLGKIFSFTCPRICSLIIFSIIFIPYGVVNAETGKSSYKNGYISHVDGYKIKFSRIIIEDNSITYKAKDSDQEQTIATDQVMNVKVEKGSEALKWGVVSALAVFLGASVGVSSNNSGVEVDSSVKRNIVLGLTAVSALIGTAIGYSKKKYATVYSNPKYQPKTELNFLYSTNIKNPIGLMLTYRF